jgi:hypothetical protein
VLQRLDERKKKKKPADERALAQEHEPMSNGG